MKRIIPIFVCLMLIFCLFGCSENKAVLDDHQFCLAMNKQVTVITNQLTTQAILSQNVTNGTQKTNLSSALNSLEIIADAMSRIELLNAPIEYEENKQSTIQMAETAKSHLMMYIKALESDTCDTDYSSFASLLQNDFVVLTAEFNVYYK